MNSYNKIWNDEYQIGGRPKPSHHGSDPSCLIWILTVWMCVSEVVSPGSGYGQCREISAVREWFPHLLALVAQGKPGEGMSAEFWPEKTHTCFYRQGISH